GLAAAVERQRQPGEVGVELAAEVVHHALADADAGVVAADAEGTEERVHEDERDAGGEEQLPRRRASRPGEGQRMTPEHVVDDHLRRRWLGELEEPAEEHLEDGAREREPVWPQPAEDLPDDPQRAPHDRFQAARAAFSFAAPLMPRSPRPAATMSYVSLRMRPR